MAAEIIIAVLGKQLVDIVDIREEGRCGLGLVWKTQYNINARIYDELNNSEVENYQKNAGSGKWQPSALYYPRYISARIIHKRILAPGIQYPE